MHLYIPGWEIPKMMPEYFTDNYGFITDNFSEALRTLRKLHKLMHLIIILN
jgi:ATP-dependent Lon protease